MFKQSVSQFRLTKQYDYFWDDLNSFLKQASFYEAAKVVFKIGSGLKTTTTITKIWLSNYVKHFVVYIGKYKIYF